LADVNCFSVFDEIFQIGRFLLWSLPVIFTFFLSENSQAIRREKKVKITSKIKK